MNCQQIARMLSASQDGELTPDLELEVRQHLRGCAVCREEGNRLQQVVRRLRLVPPPAIDPFFPARVMAGLGTRPLAARRLAQAVAYALAFFLIFAAGFALQTGSGRRATAVPAAAATYSSVLLEPQDFGLLSVHDDTLGLFAEAGRE
ncbi:MAG: zf-HC2 domain-containing protein [Acidobacteria bacterium]|jgi:anti-sigma factor RsiW|nr:zf-HC2 domain-containing protein [Acidobacteriota bacterium]